MWFGPTRMVTIVSKRELDGVPLALEAFFFVARVVLFFVMPEVALCLTGAVVLADLRAVCMVLPAMAFVFLCSALGKGLGIDCRLDLIGVGWCLWWCFWY